jgi:hypothetical protein
VPTKVENNIIINKPMEPDIATLGIGMVASANGIVASANGMCLR